MKLLVIEDDEEIAEQVARALASEGFAVAVAHDGAEGLEEASMGGFGLVILDVMLPGLDGWTVCRRLRKRQLEAPILMLTAKDAVEDRVRGLEEGADDYLVKPFDARELVARVRALLRRDKTMRTGVIQIADLEIDTRARKVSRAGQEMRLTPREYSLLEALARNVGRTLTREVILESVWDADENTDNAVSFHVASLRRKVDSGFPLRLIHTVHGFGYVLRTPEGAS